MLNPSATGHRDWADDLILVYLGGSQFGKRPDKSHPIGAVLLELRTIQTRRVEFLHEKKTHFGLVSSGFDQCRCGRMNKLVSQAANSRVRFVAEKCNR